MLKFILLFSKSRCDLMVKNDTLSSLSLELRGLHNREMEIQVSPLVVMITGEHVWVVRCQWTCDFLSLNLSSRIAGLSLFQTKATANIFLLACTGPHALCLWSHRCEKESALEGHYISCLVPVARHTNHIFLSRQRKVRIVPAYVYPMRSRLNIFLLSIQWKVER